MELNSYLLVSLKGQEVCAYPSRGVPSSLWHYFPSRGRGFISSLLKILEAVHFDRVMWPLVVNPLKRNGVLISDLIMELAEDLQELEELDLAVCWPHSSRSVARVYGYLINKKAKTIAGYLKGASGVEDVECLDNEIEAVCKLEHKAVTFRYPRFHKRAVFGATKLFARFDLLPISKEPEWSLESWGDSIWGFKKEFARGTYKHVPVAEVANLKWVQLFCSSCNEKVVAAFCKSLKECDFVSICATHGDMACHNFRYDGEKTWIFDWESYTEEGPILVDELTVFMCVRRFRLGWSVARTFADLERNYPISNPKTRHEVIQAMAFILAYKLSMSDVLGVEMVKYANAG